MSPEIKKLTFWLSVATCNQQYHCPKVIAAVETPKPPHHERRGVATLLHWCASK